MSGRERGLRPADGVERPPDRVARVVVVVLEERWRRTDELLRDMGPEVVAWCRASHRRAEADARSLRENVIRWLVMVADDAMAAIATVWWHEVDKQPSVPVTPVLPVEVRPAAPAHPGEARSER